MAQSYRESLRSLAREREALEPSIDVANGVSSAGRRRSWAFDSAAPAAESYGLTLLLCGVGNSLSVALFEITVIGLAACGASALSQFLHLGQGLPSQGLALGLVAGVLFACFVRVVSAVQRASGLRGSGQRTGGALTAWSATVAALLFFFIAVFPASQLVPRHSGAVIWFLVLGYPAAWLARVALPRWWEQAIARSNVLRGESFIIGPEDDPLVEAIAEQLHAMGCPKSHILQFDANCPQSDWSVARADLLSAAKEAMRCAGHGPIFLCASRPSSGHVISIRRGLGQVPRAIYAIGVAVAESDPGAYSIMRIGPYAAAELRRDPSSWTARVAKRLVDVGLSLLLIAVLSPLLAAIALAVKVSSPGPILFCQRRTGYQGQPFRIFKFRTMRVMEDGDTIVQACRDDARVTPIGAFLRKTSLDELPQLFNVLLGTMSVVGPRPHAIAHDQHFSQLIGNYSLRQHLKPGITGWAQVNGFRGETIELAQMRSRVNADLWYAANASIFLDLQILARTLIEVIRPRNAF